MDNVLNSLMESIERPFLTRLSVFIDGAFDPWLLVFLGVLVSGYFFYKKLWKKGFVVAGLFIFLGILVLFFKEIIARERPANFLIEAAGYSFPSGHVAISVLFFGVLAYLISLRKSVAVKMCFCLSFILLVLLVGFSRVYLRVHWFSDVLFGFVLGGAVLITGIAILQKMS